MLLSIPHDAKIITASHGQVYTEGKISLSFLPQLDFGFSILLSFCLLLGTQPSYPQEFFLKIAVAVSNFA